jgi:hypothetical protein
MAEVPSPMRSKGPQSASGGLPIFSRMGHTTDRQHRQSCLMQHYAWSRICSNISFTSDTGSEYAVGVTSPLALD